MTLFEVVTAARVTPSSEPLSPTFQPSVPLMLGRPSPAPCPSPAPSPASAAPGDSRSAYAIKPTRPHPMRQTAHIASGTTRTPSRVHQRPGVCVVFLKAWAVWGLAGALLGRTEGEGHDGLGS